MRQLLTPVLLGMAAFCAAPALAHERVVLHSVTQIYPSLPPGTYYPVAQGLFGADRGRAAPVYVYVRPETPRPSAWHRAEPLAPRYGRHMHAPHEARGFNLKDGPSVPSAPWMDYGVRGEAGVRYRSGMVAYGCRGCLHVEASEPVVIVHKFQAAPKKRKPKRAPQRPLREVDPLED